MKTILLLFAVLGTFAGAQNIPDVPQFPAFQRAGYLDGSRSDRKLFFWAMSDSDSTDAPKEKPLLVFLSGGPGVPAAHDVFYGTGPYRLSCDTPFAFPCPGKLTLLKNEYSPVFNGFNALWVENVGVGFSYSTTGSFPADSQGVAADLRAALLQYAQMPESLLRRGTPLYIVGHSYGAKSAVMLGRSLLLLDGTDDDDDDDDDQLQTSLRKGGIFLANGLLDTIRQARAWTPFSLNMGLTGDVEAAAYIAKVESLVELIEQGSYVEASNQYYPLVQNMVGFDLIYDVFNVSPERDQVASYVGYLSVVNSTQWLDYLRVKPMPASTTQDGWAAAFYSDVSVPYVQYLSPLVTNGTRVLVSAAQADAIVCTAGVQDYLNSAIGGFKEAPSADVCGKAADDKVPFPIKLGTKRSVSLSGGSLTFVMQRGGGHFYAHDQPLHFLQRMRIFAGMEKEIKCASMPYALK